ncbi:methylmalonyl Co-A mutase-associated GTPase MeaB [Thermomicrobiaceae bacterium CFH 74404]|uniref:Methylmalonyl Co-A mutase-associated GTPase MeaB n=1 Tax=Thermalbibacter longus TaxID=2951981 RepID=A0AA41WE42_9BACT|nr:methylmalonyl Co-A mutase-associated GTPase MeaB [Thermalbibacter longus]MCM8750382.1 methylmalonyl Co-A mutase-associated GTPase MeaB [Thermalbibacter longus]
MSDLLERFRAGERRALARLLSHVENRTPFGIQAERELYPLTGRAHLIGITGPPGAGKSTLVAGLIREARRQSLTAAVLAVDPTSPVTGGAVMGDRIRMLDVQSDEGVFIRSVTGRGRGGGLAPALCAMAHVLDAFGFDLVLLETVGAGQDDVDIARLADTTVLVLVPGLGDGVQSLKAGTLEVADIFVVNKADLPGANQVVRDLRVMQRLMVGAAEQAPILSTVATTGEGIDQVLRAILEHRRQLEIHGQLTERTQRRLLAEARYLALEALADQLDEVLETLPAEDRASLETRQLDPRTLAMRLIERLRLSFPASRS